MITDICLVQASGVIPDAEVIAALPALNAWAKLVTDSHALTACKISFMTLAQWKAGQASDTPPLFLNRHSTDPGAAGFHSTMPDGAPFGRSFSGDDILDGVNPWVTITHETGEMIGNLWVKNFVTLKDGSTVPRELSDAVEDDIQAIVIGGIPCSNFVLETYWQDTIAYPPGTTFDYQGRLSGPCPTLTPGGYQSILAPGGQQWTQVTAMHLGSRPRPSVRSQRFHGSLRHQQLEATWAARVIQ